MFSGTEFNFQQHLLSELQACWKGKFRHLHFVRYLSHIQNTLTAQRLHYHSLALSATTVSYCRFSRCSCCCSIRERKGPLSYLTTMLCWNAYKVLQKPFWLPSIGEGVTTAYPTTKISPLTFQEAEHTGFQGLRVELFSSAYQPHRKQNFLFHSQDKNTTRNNFWIRIYTILFIRITDFIGNPSRQKGICAILQKHRKHSNYKYPDSTTKILSFTHRLMLLYWGKTKVLCHNCKLSTVTYYHSGNIGLHLHWTVRYC